VSCGPWHLKSNFHSSCENQCSIDVSADQLQIVENRYSQQFALFNPLIEILSLHFNKVTLLHITTDMSLSDGHLSGELIIEIGVK
jgi:hypothetical protein